jgi:hypothetical protein
MDALRSRGASTPKLEAEVNVHVYPMKIHKVG